MKISIGTNIKDGPWGGGNLFAINLKNYLQNIGFEVINDLSDDDINIIILTEPRKTSESSAFTDLDVLKYKKYVNKECLVIHRINECDERKNTNYVNKYLIQANRVADATIFVSEWLKKLFLDQGLKSKENYVVYAGADSNVFNADGFLPWDHKSKLKIVTHHWGANWNKGFDIYSELDNMLGSSKYKERIEFNYIGNLPKNFTFKNSNHIEPMSGKDLADCIKTNHLYLTASKNEPSGNHHIEGLQCGLPILFLESGGTTEYCKDYGLGYTNETFVYQLNNMISNYDDYLIKAQDYPNNSDNMCSEYLRIINQINEGKDEFEPNPLFDNKNYISKYLYLKKRNFNSTN